MSQDGKPRENNQAFQPLDPLLSKEESRIAGLEKAHALLQEKYKILEKIYRMKPQIFTN